jgi:hypothetical protein
MRGPMGSRHIISRRVQEQIQEMANPVKRTPVRTVT